MGYKAGTSPEKSSLLRLSPQEEEYLVNQEQFWQLQELKSQVGLLKEVINVQRVLIDDLKAAIKLGY